MRWFCFKTCDNDQHTSLPSKNGHRNSHFGRHAGTIWYLYCFYKSGFRSVSRKGHERFGFHHSWKIPRLSDVMCRFNLCESQEFPRMFEYRRLTGHFYSYQMTSPRLCSARRSNWLTWPWTWTAEGAMTEVSPAIFFRARNQEAINSINPSNGRWWRWNGRQNIAVMVPKTWRGSETAEVVVAPAGPFWMYLHHLRALQGRLGVKDCSHGVLAESRQSDVEIPGKWVPLRQPQLFDEGSISGSFFDALKFGESQGWHPPHSFMEKKKVRNFPIIDRRRL